MNEPTCGDCGQELTLVRPGKHQCDNSNCIQNNSKPESVPSCGEQSDEKKYAKALAFKLLWSYALSGRRITKFEDLEEYATEWFEANDLEAPTKH